jgi:hypothetical protein
MEGAEHKLAFWMRYGLNEPTVMQFETTNAPADFQGYINNTIREALDDFTSARLDDILIYSDSEADHIGHVKWIILRLLEAELYSKPETGQFGKDTVQYLRLIPSTQGILMVEDPVETGCNWSLENQTEIGRLNNHVAVQHSLRCCNDYG